MRNLVKKCIVFIFVITLLLPVSVMAENKGLGSKIQYTIIQPEAVYAVKPGQNLKYVLKVILPVTPKELAKELKNFIITVKIDGDLLVTNAKIREIKPIDKKIGLTVTKSPNVKNNTVSFIVKDIKSLGNLKEFNIDIDTKAKKGMKGDNFTNSTVLTYETNDGNQSASGQKDISSNTKKENGILKVTNEIYNSTKSIKGQTEPNAIIKVFMEDKQIANGKSDSKGNYEIKIQPLEEGTKLKVVSYFNNEENIKIADVDIQVKKEESKDKNLNDEIKKQEEKIEALKESEKYNENILKDYIKHSKNINTENTSEENKARIKAAIAYGEYIEVKSSTTTLDYKASIEKIKEAIQAIRKPYMKGFNKSEFGPDEKITRAEVAAVLSRIINGKDPVGEFTSFKDVNENKWYSESVAFMEKAGLIKGYSDNTFKPENGITRAEFASIIAKYMGNNIDDNSVDGIKFTDVKESFWAKGSIDYISSKGIMSGRGNNKFEPNEKITRAEVAKVLNQVQGWNIDKEFMNKYSKNPFKDVKENFWAYYDILEATGN